MHSRRNNMGKHDVEESAAAVDPELLAVEVVSKTASLIRMLQTQRQLVLRAAANVKKKKIRLWRRWLFLNIEHGPFLYM